MNRPPPRRYGKKTPHTAARVVQAQRATEAAAFARPAPAAAPDPPLPLEAQIEMVRRIVPAFPLMTEEDLARAREADERCSDALEAALRLLPPRKPRPV